MRNMTTLSLASLAMCFGLSLPAQSEVQQENPSKNAREEILKITSSHAVARCLHLAADLCLADYLEKEPQSLESLAKLSRTHPKALYRVMRVLVTHGIFGYTADHKFTLTDTSKLLLSNHPESLRTAVAKEFDLRRWNAVGYLESAVREGKPSFEEVYGETFYDYIENDPKAKERFDAGMSNYSKVEDKAIVKAFDFTPFKTIVDVGGNQGSLSAEILKASPSSEIILFDLPETVKNPKYLTENDTFKGRYRVVGGDFFESIPSGGDVYILKRVLHNWDDENSLKILKNCAKHLSPEGRILIIDLVEEPLSPTTKASPYIDFDVSSGLVLTNGVERTKEEFATLLNKAGLELQAIHNPQMRIRIVEAKLAS